MVFWIVLSLLNYMHHPQYMFSTTNPTTLLLYNAFLKYTHTYVYMHVVKQTVFRLKIRPLSKSNIFVKLSNKR